MNELTQKNLIALRRDLHQHPELSFEEHRTSEIVARELTRLGFHTTKIASTGVIGTLSRGTSRKTIGIRADMDALPIHETTNLAYASKTQGVMHACGHDGHTVSLLGAARKLSASQIFDGTVHLIFQPAEEDISGAKRMIDEGLFQKFPMDAIFALHNLPGLELGHIKVRAGAITARVDIVNVTVRGRGGHGALPHLTADPIVATSGIVLALQTAVSRNLDPVDVGVVTVGGIHGGNLGTVIPSEVTLTLGVRTVTDHAADLMKKRVPEIIHAQAQSFGCTADVEYSVGIVYPAGINDSAITKRVHDLALKRGHTEAEMQMPGPMMFSEDFAFMQQHVPSCYFFMGNGNSNNLHDSGYDFNDGLIEKAADFWVALVEDFLQSETLVRSRI